MLFRPLLAEAASATLEPRHVVVPLRQMCPRAEIVVGTATALDEQARTVAVESHAGTFDVRYERLVLALGSVARTLPVPGLAEHALGFNDLADAIALRNHVLAELEVGRPCAREAAAPLLRLRRRGLRRRRGARRAQRPRARRAPLLPSPPSRAAALGARRGGRPDPARALAAPCGVRVEAARPPGDRGANGDAARAARRGVGDPLRRGADRDAHTRLDDRRARAPAARRMGPPGRRARPRPGGRAACGSRAARRRGRSEIARAS